MRLLVVLPLLAACQADDLGAPPALPGDVDDLPASGDGKADEWGASNDPTGLRIPLEYSFEKQPRQGAIRRPFWENKPFVARPDEPVAWADTYWPTVTGSTNFRWQGHAYRSPLEKYDAAFHQTLGCHQPAESCGPGAVDAWGAYIACAGPSAAWQASRQEMVRTARDGIDSDRDGQIDECDDQDGLPSWFGLCHAWAAASLLLPEPLHDVTYELVTFTPGDIKALVATVFDGMESYFIGGRCHARTLTLDATGRPTDPTCLDLNPGAWHVAVTSSLGEGEQFPLVMDRTAHQEVWNQPILGFRVTRATPVDRKQAGACVGRAEYPFTSVWAKHLVEVEMDVDYGIEGEASRTPLGIDGHRATDHLHYVLEIDSRGKVIGGEWCGASRTDHPDFVWRPVKPKARGKNPYVQTELVRWLVYASRE